MHYCIIPSLIWAFSYGIIKNYMHGLDPNLVTFCRIAIALPFFLPFLQWKKVSNKEILNLILIGAIQYGIMYFCFMRSFAYLEAHQVALFTTATPLYVTLLHDLLAAKFSMRSLKITLLAIVGGGVIFYQYAHNDNVWNIFIGFLLVQISDICFAFGQVAYKRFRALRADLNDKEIFGFLFMGALSVSAILTTRSGAWGGLSLMSIAQIGVLFYLGIIASGLAFFCWNKGATRVNATTLAVLNNLKAPLAIVVSLVFFHEQTEIIRLIIGLSIIGFALLLSTRTSLRSSTKPIAAG
jgi:drug/metabolite transporter (DMT)-like permease